jgi:hypothetical protein
LWVGPGDGVPDAVAGPEMGLAGAGAGAWARALLANTAAKPTAATALSPVACQVSLDRRRKPWWRASSAGPPNSAG